MNLFDFLTLIDKTTPYDVIDTKTGREISVFQLFHTDFDGLLKMQVERVTSNGDRLIVFAR